MAYDVLGPLKSIPASIALNSQFIFVTINSSGQLALPTAGAFAYGVTQDTPAAGDPSAICGPGAITKVLCSATVTAGARVATDANGNCVSSVSGDYELGIALTAGAAGFLCDILYQPIGIVQP